MSIQRFLRMGGGRERRQSRRVDCRLQCSLKRGRRWVAARVLDVSAGGLCVLSPVRIEAKRHVLLRIDVPRRGPVEVQAIAWHVRQVKSGRAHRKAWSIGMMIEKAGEGFQALLPEGESLRDLDVFDAVSEQLSALPPESRVPAPGEDDHDDTLDEDLLSKHDLDALDLDLLSPEELQAPAAQRGPSPDDTLRMFRVRVKARSGPRTRALTFGAVSAAEAEALAREELDDAWQVLEVRPA